MKTFETKGTYTQKGKKHGFESKIMAENEKLAKEKIYAQFGGKNGVDRRHIEISEIKVTK
jgi:ribosomal protein L20A (L18A)